MNQAKIDDWNVTEDEEYERVPELKSTDVDIVMEWALKQPHLPKFPRHRVILFLRACDYSLERTKETIAKYFALRTRHSDLLASTDFFSPSTQKAMTKLHLGIMPEKDDRDNFYIYLRIHRSTLSEWTPNEYIKLALQSFEISHLTLGSGNSYTFVVDMKDVNVPLILATPVSSIQVTLQFLQEASHYKIKSVEFINAGSVVDKVMALLKPFLNQQVREAIHTHSSWETLTDRLNPKFVPNDYGGKGPSMKQIHEATQGLFENKNDWFKEDSKLINDVNKRLSTSKYSSYEMEGSFRKLEID